jgi:hypothetical protein
MPIKKDTEADKNPAEKDIKEGVEKKEEVPKRVERVERPPEVVEKVPAREIPRVPEKEKVKEVEKEVEEIEVPKKVPPAPPPPSPIMKDEELVADLQHVMSLDKPKQIKVLVYLAFKKGIHHSFNIARQLRDPYLLDEFHDTLVDELYDLLVKKKKIKPYK